MNRFYGQRERKSLHSPPSKAHPYDVGNIVHDDFHLSPMAGSLINYAEQMTSVLDLGIAW